MLVYSKMTVSPKGVVVGDAFHLYIIYSHTFPVQTFTENGIPPSGILQCLYQGNGNWRFDETTTS